MWSLPSLGAWIETEFSLTRLYTVGRSLHWERGLKQSLQVCKIVGKESLPSLGAWIETFDEGLYVLSQSALPSLGAWIETSAICHFIFALCCRSLHWERGLKHAYLLRLKLKSQVAPFIGSVGLKHETIELRDRMHIGSRSLHWERGLKLNIMLLPSLLKSLPSLGAWIETLPVVVVSAACKVAPFIGGVD